MKEINNHHLPWEPKTFIFGGHNPYIEGLKPSFFMILGSKGSWWFISTHLKTYARQFGSFSQGFGVKIENCLYFTKMHSPLSLPSNCLSWVSPSKACVRFLGGQNWAFGPTRRYTPLKSFQNSQVNEIIRLQLHTLVYLHPLKLTVQPFIFRCELLVSGRVYQLYK